MKIRKLLEKYYNSYELKNPFYLNTNAIEVFVNPSLKEMNKIIKDSDHKEIRFAIIDKKLYVWNYKFLHNIVLEKMGKRRSDLRLLTGIIKKKNKWIFNESHQIKISIREKNKEYLNSIINKDYSWVDKYVEFTPKWNHYKKQMKKVLK